MDAAEEYKVLEGHLEDAWDDYRAALEIGADELAAERWTDIRCIENRMAALSEHIK